MKKLILASALTAGMLVLTSCGGYGNEITKEEFTTARAKLVTAQVESITCKGSVFVTGETEEKYDLVITKDNASEEKSLEAMSYITDFNIDDTFQSAVITSSVGFGTAKYYQDGSKLAVVLNYSMADSGATAKDDLEVQWDEHTYPLRIKENATYTEGGEVTEEIKVDLTYTYVYTESK